MSLIQQLKSHVAEESANERLYSQEDAKTILAALEHAYTYFATLTGRNEEINDAEHVGDVATGMVINSDGLDELFEKAAIALGTALDKAPPT